MLVRQIAIVNSILVLVIFILAGIAGCRNEITAVTQDPGNTGGGNLIPDGFVDPANRSGLAIGTPGTSPLIQAVAAELGIADCDVTDPASLAAGVAQSVAVAFNLAELMAGDENATAMLAAAQAAGVPVLFENTVALADYEEILEKIAALDVANLDANAIARVIADYTPSAELDVAMQAMAQAMGIGVDSQLALFVPVLNTGQGIVDGEAVESVVYLLGADTPLEVMNVTGDYEIDGVPVADADVPDEDDRPIPQVPIPEDLTDVLDPEKLTPSSLITQDLDPAALATEILDVLRNEVPALLDTSHTASSGGEHQTAYYTGTQPQVSGIVHKDWTVRGQNKIWYPCDKTQECSLRIDARVQLYRSESRSGEVTKYLRICSGDNYWRMGGPQYFDERDDQGYYMYQAKEQFGTCDSSGDWCSPPSWLSFLSYQPINNAGAREESDVRHTLPISYYDNLGVFRNWDAEWEEETDLRDWDLDVYTGTGRVTWNHRLVECQEGFYLHGWWSMLYKPESGGSDSDAEAYHGGRHSRGDSPRMYSACMAAWKATGDSQDTQRFRIYHKMWVRNTWWELHWFSDDEKKHREDNARKQFHFYVDFGDV